MKKVLSFLGNVLIVAVLAVSIIMTVAIITSTRGEKARIPNLFGYALLSVQSDSMESDKGMFVGDLIVDKLLTEDEANQLKVGDVITFIRMGTDGAEFLETHRIVEHVHDREIPAPEEEIIDGIWTRGGDKYYTTRGDNTPDVDLDASTQRIAYVYKGTIVGVWTGVRIPKLGAVMDFLQTSMGFMVCIVIPVALFFIYQLYVFIMTLTRRQKEKALEEVSSKEEELKQKAIAEFLAQQQAAGGQTAAPDTNPAALEPESDSKKKRKNKKVKQEAEAETQTSDGEDAAGEDKAEETEDDTPEKVNETETDAPDGEDAAAETESEEKAENEEAAGSEDASGTEEKTEPETEESDGEDESDEGKTEETSGSEEADSEEDASDGEDAPEEETDSDAQDTSDAAEADPDHTPEISEEEKERIIREYLAKQAQEQKPEE